MTELPLEFPASEQLANARITLRIRIGDHVQRGDIIADMETDKATQELQAFESFTLRGIREKARGYVLIIED